MRRVTAPLLLVIASAIVVIIVLTGTSASRPPVDTRTTSDSTSVSNELSKMPVGAAKSSDNRSSDDRRAFAIFTLPFEYNDSDEAMKETFTSSDYDRAMNVIRLHIGSRGTVGSNDSSSADDLPHDSIIQSIRVLSKNDDADNGQAGSRDSGGQSFQVRQPFDIFSDSSKMITVQSLDNITKAVQSSREFRNVTHILYDIEHWSRTPLNERESPVESINEAGHRVRSASLKFGITPDAIFLVENYKKIEWAEVDFLGMQLQRFSPNITEFSDYVQAISSHVRAENPSIEIFVQLSFRFTDADEMIRAIEIARPWVDGYIIAYIPTSSDCLPQCNPDGLDRVLESTRSANVDMQD